VHYASLVIEAARVFGKDEGPDRSRGEALGVTSDCARLCRLLTVGPMRYTRHNAGRVE
jgi:hypothetical protein